MEKIAYALIGAVALLWLVGMIAGMIVVMPFGLIGLAVIAGFGLLFAKVLKERLANREDDYYEHHVEK